MTDAATTTAARTLTSDDITEGQWRLLCVLVDLHRAGVPPRGLPRKRRQRKRKMRNLQALHDAGLIDCPSSQSPTPAGIALVDHSTDYEDTP